MLNDYVVEVATEKGPEHVPVTLWDSATKADLAADKLAGALGLTPESRARLLKDVGQAQHYAADQLAGLQNEGRKLREAYEARSAAAVNGHVEGPQGGSVPPETAS